MKPWQLGNTSVRSGLRTRDALIALDGSGLEGKLRGRNGDAEFRELLGTCGVVRLGDDATESVGRKFRHAMTRLGFLYPDLKGASRSDLGEPGTITPAGHRMIDAKSTQAIQECFLRAVSGIGFTIDENENHEGGNFSPLKMVLEAIFELERIGAQPRLSLTEIEAFVQLTNGQTVPSELAQRIVSYREARIAASNKKKFDAKTVEEEALRSGNPLKMGTYRDYADMNFRWLRGTGLFSYGGGGLQIQDSQRRLAEALAREIDIPSDLLGYWKNLVSGPRLPLDNEEVARAAVADLVEAAKIRGLDEIQPHGELGVLDLAVARHDLQERIAVFDELQFARQQLSRWEEILAYLVVLASPRRAQIAVGEFEVEIPRGEAPGYLEWALWRAFLAINKIKNPPNESRRFRVDADFFPLGNAPGGGPDLIFEFEDATLVVEATLLTSGRQEAAEGYSVRQHVFNVQRGIRSNEGQEVFGLFVAPSLDENAVRTFQRAEMYADGEAFRLSIVPLTIEQFSSIFREEASGGEPDIGRIIALIREIVQVRDSHPTPGEWCEAIAERVLAFAS